VTHLEENDLRSGGRVASKLQSMIVDVSPLRESRTFRRLFIGRTILILGVGFVAITVPLEMYSQTNSTAQVGLVASVESIAFLVGFLSGGVLADRGDRWTVLPVSVAVCALSFVGLTLNAAWSDVQWPIFILVAVNGVSGAIGITAVLAVLPSVAGREKFHAVGALNALSVRCGAVFAPLAGGVVFAALGAAWNFGFAAVFGILSVPLFLRPRDQVPREEPVAGDTEGPIRSLWTGYQFIVRDRVVLGVMVAGVVGMLGGGVLVMIPAFVDARFGGNSTVVGLIYSALSVGSIIGAVGSGWVRTVARPGLLLLAMMLACFILYTAAGISSTVILVLLFIGLGGAALSMEEVLRYALLQLRTPDELLGRVNSAFAAQSMTGAAVGALVAAAFSGVVGPSDAFWVYNAAMALVSVVVMLALPGLRRTERAADADPTAAQDERARP
jgi:MFS transporter, ENTS family, enterobactin (siderophore) exporter